MMDYDQSNFLTQNQTYKLWKKHSPFLYNLIQTYPLPTCSQTTAWFSQAYLQNDWSIHHLLIGTNSISNNAIVILSVGIPTDDAMTDYASYKEEPPQSEVASNSYVGTMGTQNLVPKITIPQASQVMKARINKLDEQLIAVKTGGSNPQLLVYDLRNKEQELEQNVIKLAGHEYQGFGLDWHPSQPGIVLSGSDDLQILTFDLTQGNQNANWNASDGVEDVKWSFLDPHIFGSAQADQKICIWDSREGEKNPSLSKKAHNGQVYSIDFNAKSPHLLISGGEDSDICFWDIRNLSKKLHTLVGHNDAVNVVTWNPQHSLQFASGSSDRRVVLWDLQRLNMNTKEKSGNEMLFIHGGHRSKVTDVSWGGPEKELLGSTEQNNTLQVWKMNERISQV